MTRVLVIDNYDSFTWNLVHLIGPARVPAWTWCATTRSPPTRSSPPGPTPSCCRPGPARPTRPGSASTSCDARRADRSRPSACASGSRRSARSSAAPSRARPLPMHGKVSTIAHGGQTIFRGINGPIAATRYHSLIVERGQLPGGAGGHGGDRRRSHHGPVPPLAADPRGAVPSGEHPVGARRRRSCELLRPRRGLECRAPARAGLGGPRVLPRRCIESPMESFKPYLAKVATGASLTREEARAAFDDLLSGEVTPAQGGAFLMALRVRGEALDEIVGAVTAMRGRMIAGQRARRGHRHRRHRRRPFGQLQHLDPRRDHRGRLRACRSPSTATGRHRRNRAPPTCSPRSASSSASTRPACSAACGEAGLCFMFAQTHHAAMRHVAPVRVELGTRTIFNLLGPLVQPGRRQAPASRRVLRGLARAPDAGSEGDSAPRRSGRCTDRTGSTR